MGARNLVGCAMSMAGQTLRSKPTLKLVFFRGLSPMVPLVV